MHSGRAGESVSRCVGGSKGGTGGWGGDSGRSSRGVSGGGEAKSPAPQERGRSEQKGKGGEDPAQHSRNQKELTGISEVIKSS